MSRFVTWVKTRHYFRDQKFWAFVILLIAAIWANYQAWQIGKDAQETSDQVAAIQTAFINETAKRRDESCKGYELGHKQEVTELERSFDLLENPTPEIKPFIDAFIQDPRVLAQTAEEIRAATNDQDEYGVYVPSYCDEPGFGLEEPDPDMPKTPPKLQKRLNALKELTTP